MSFAFLRNCNPVWPKAEPRPAPKTAPQAKVCIDCKQTLPADEFYRTPINKDGLNGRCKTCYRAERRSRYARGLT